MSKNQPLIHLANIDSAKLPNYYNYAFAIEKVRERLNDKYGGIFKLYNAEEGLTDVLEATEDILANDPEEIELVANIYDSAGAATVYYSNENKYEVKPSTYNNILYFPKYEVAIITIPIYQSMHNYMENFIFAKNDTSVLEFLDYTHEIQRQYMLQGITVFTDTEEGVKRTREQITKQIQREDILLAEDLKTDIFRSIDEFFLHSGTFFKTYDIPYKRGILLYGSPGNGKTTLVKSIAESVTAPIVYWQITEFTHSYSIKEIFSKVTKLAPMILVIEDIDSMPKESRSVFLNTLDGATTKEGIFLIGTTNYPEKIDPALINRAGRFDRAYEIKQPDDLLRRNYLHKKGIAKFIDEQTLNQLIEKTNGLSIAQLNELYMSIALQWHYDQEVTIEKIITDLQKNNKNTIKNDWELAGNTDRLGF
ncbi:ATP-binding protein [Ornithinibacillus salinisoli]|uniref:ATP-binding protein n=1 Tax=Ornithinibacillus salinisoli TaxID=1848459 RepID=A0ABW4VXB5_9BACI